MTALALDVRELNDWELDEVTGGPGPVGAGVGAVLGGISGAGSAMASGGSVGAIVGAAVGGALVGGAVGFFTPGNNVRLAANILRSGQAGLISGAISGAVARAIDG